MPCSPLDAIALQRRRLRRISGLMEQQRLFQHWNCVIPEPGSAHVLWVGRAPPTGEVNRPRFQTAQAMGRRGRMRN